MEDFIKRIGLILEVKNLNYSDFAEAVGIQRSMVSHIMSGRNNPSLDVVTKILSSFPDLRSEWLLFGKGAMMHDPLPEVKNDGKNIDIPARQAETAKKTGIVQQQLSMEFPESYPEIENEIPKELVEIQGKRKEEKVSVSGNTIAGENLDLQYTEKSMAKESWSPIGSNSQDTGEVPVIKKKSVEKIVIFYTDHTFREYSPEV